MLSEYVSVSGVVAKEFFEKSKLPVQELSKIWYWYQRFWFVVIMVMVMVMMTMMMMIKLYC